ncbi:MAG: TRAP transporter large permease [Deferrisomatales bacterium]|nr:TRAP transporter large permease [Deferrisomatales bacterium]
MDGDIVYVLAIFIGLLGLTVPVYLSLFFAGIIGLAFFAQAMIPLDIQAMLLLEGFYKSMDNFSLVAVLFFVLCGNIMTGGSIVDKLLGFAKALVGFFPGGLGMAGILACALFGAISGSTVATVVAIGGFMIPALVHEGYDERYAIGVMTTSPILGIIIPPSVAMILYSAVTNDSLAALFMTGYTPGMLIVASFCLYSYVVARRGGLTMQKPYTFSEFVGAIRRSVWAILLPVIIFVGIYSGAFTANEAAVVACMYAFIVEIFIHRDMTLAQARKIIVSSAVTASTLLIIVAGSSVFGKFLTVERLPEFIAQAVTANITSQWVFLLVVNLFLLGVGMFMDIVSATIIITPILLPLLAKFEINSLHFGILMAMNLGIGYVTPPVGVSLYIASTIARRDLVFVLRAVMPFILIQMGVLAVLTYWPDFSLWLPKIFFPDAVEAGAKVGLDPSGGL